MKYFLLFLIVFSYFLQSKCEYQLVWSDEFSGTALDPNVWNIDTGDQWYNNELQSYSKNNVFVENGYLRLEARKENYLSKAYTSGRINSEHKKYFTYGKFEARMKLPIGQGMWPAFWLWPESWIPSSYREIDIMEAVGNYPKTVYSTCWTGTENDPNQVTFEYELTANYDQDYHVYSAEWKPGQVEFAVDGKVFSSCTKGESPLLWDYDNSSTNQFHIIFNLAIGGDWAGAPNSKTVFPSSTYVDYVRVYQDSSSSSNNTVNSTTSGKILCTDYTSTSLKNGIQYLKIVGKVATTILKKVTVSAKSDCCKKCGNTVDCIALSYLSQTCTLLRKS